MKPDDEKRTRIMDAMFSNGGIEPNYSKISELTGYDVKTVKNSIFFLEKEKIIRGYVPFIDAQKIGFGDLGLTVMQLDFVDKDKKRIDEKIMEELPNNYLVYDTDKPGLMNRAVVSIFRNEAERYKKLKEVDEKIGTGKILRDRISVPLLERVKHSSISRAIVEILLKEKGIKPIATMKYER